MTITQTVEIPSSRRLVIDVPLEIPTGTVILTFTPSSTIKKKMTKAEEIEYINRNAENLNKEAEDVLLYQDIDSFEKDIERFTSQDISLMRSTTVLFNLADIVFDRDDDRPNSASEKVHPV